MMSACIFFDGFVHVATWLLSRPAGRGAAWSDPDDANLVVEVAGKARLRKLRAHDKQTAMDGGPGVCAKYWGLIPSRRIATARDQHEAMGGLGVSSSGLVNKGRVRAVPRAPLPARAHEHTRARQAHEAGPASLRTGDSAAAMDCTRAPITHARLSRQLTAHLHTSI